MSSDDEPEAILGATHCSKGARRCRGETETLLDGFTRYGNHFSRAFWTFVGWLRD